MDKNKDMVDETMSKINKSIFDAVVTNYSEDFMKKWMDLWQKK